MSILSWINRPKWQSNNEQIRLTAVQHSDEAELKAHLLQIIDHDDSAKVQKAALNRLTNLGALANVANEHKQADIRTFAEKRLTQRLIDIEADQLNETEIRLVKFINHSDNKRQIIERAKANDLKIAVLATLTQQGLLGDLLLVETDANIQQLILAKINQDSTLKRILTTLSQKQTTLKQAIKEKLNAQNPVDSTAMAEALCKQLENVVLKNQSADLSAIESQWQTLNDLPEKLMTRFQGALNTAKLTLDSSYRETFLQQQQKIRQQQALQDLIKTIETSENSRLSELQSDSEKFNKTEIDQLSATEQAQWQALLVELQGKLSQSQQATALPDACYHLLEEINKELEQKTVLPKRLNLFKKRWQQATKSLKPSEDLTDLQQQFDQGLLKLADKITASANQRDAAADKALTLIEPIEAKIKEGHLTDAKSEMNKLNELLKKCGFNHPKIKGHKFEIDQLWQQLKELRQWQQWSHDKVRNQLIEDLNALIGSGMHPDAILQKLQQANQQWSDLEDMEKLPGDRYSPRNQKQWQTFRAVSQALFEPAQPFFEKRSEQQDKKRNDVMAHVAQMNQTDLDDTESPELARLNQQAVNHLKRLDRLSPKDRGHTAKSIRSAMERINNHLAAGYKAAEVNKQKLVDQAIALVEEDNIENAIETAKDLQKQWPKQGYVKPHTERKLWKKFRQANDRVFNRRSNQQQAQRAATDKHQKIISQWIKKYRQLIAQCTEVVQLSTIMDEARTEWQSLSNEANNEASNDTDINSSINSENLEREQNKKWQHLVADINARKQHLKSHQQQQQLKTWQKIDELYLKFEEGKLNQDTFEQQLKAYDQAALAPFQNRQDTSSNTNEVLQLLIEAEYQTGIDTPEDFHEQRMAYQVQVLADRMAGEETVERGQDRARDWLRRWYAMPKVNKGSDNSFQQQKQRIKKALNAISKLATQDD